MAGSLKLKIESELQRSKYVYKHRFFLNFSLLSNACVDH